MAKHNVRTDDWIVTVVTLAGSNVNVTTAPARLGGVYVNVALSAHAIDLKSGATTLFTIPASAAAGTFYPITGATFPSSLIVAPNAAGTGSISVLWDPQ